MTTRGQAKLESILLTCKGFAAPTPSHRAAPLLPWPSTAQGEGGIRPKERGEWPGPESGFTAGQGRLKFTLRLDPDVICASA